MFLLLPQNYKFCGAGDKSFGAETVGLQILWSGVAWSIKCCFTIPSPRQHWRQDAILKYSIIFTSLQIILSLHSSLKASI